MELKTKVQAEEGRQELYITREFDLPVELLFKAFAEPDIVEQWMGTKVLKMENKKHGAYAFETIHNEKVVFSANGCIHEFSPNEKIIRTFEMEQAATGVQLEILSFEKLTDETSQLTTHIIFQSEQHRAEQLKMPFEYGINMAHNKLQDILKNKK